MNYKKPKTVSLFSEVPLVPVTHFEKVRLPHGTYDNAWHLVSPTIQRNSKSGFQELICIAFLEGMRMASSAAKETSHEHG